ncbi:MAG: ligase-associated DNA damage response exonuclease [Candidatus Thorarchaeota archaeon]
MNQLLVPNENGLYCEKGDFYIDPWKPIKTALITHGHSDHATSDHNEYFSSESTVPILKHRLGQINITGVKFSQKIKFKDVTVSFHPAGHVLGSSQIRVDDGEQVWVVSGDYKRTFDPTCEPFEIVKCDTFITEATFALPIYRWKPTRKVIEEIYSWWEANKKENKASVLFCYALGKAQRILAELMHFTNESIYIHGAMEPLINLYRDAGIKLLPTISATEQPKGFDFSDKLIIAPTSAFRSTWMRRFGDSSNAFASGWMTVRAQKTQGGYDKGFVLSDHCDWYDLIQTIKDTQASTVYVTHGRSNVLVRYLHEELGINSFALKTEFKDDED